MVYNKPLYLYSFKNNNPKEINNKSFIMVIIIIFLFEVLFLCSIKIFKEIAAPEYNRILLEYTVDAIIPVETLNKFNG